MIFLAISFGLYGLIIGSFLNVLVLRKGVMSLSGRSRCPSCVKEIKWYDNVPVISWFLLRARCRECGSAISVQYPLVESATGILFAFVASAAYPEILFSAKESLLLLTHLVIVSLLVAITVYDFRHTIIPDEWSYLFAAVALAISVLASPSVWALLAGPVAAAPLFFLWLISQGKWMGLGDPKLALGIGWLLGLETGIIAVFASFIIGSLVLVPLLLYEQLVTHKPLSGARSQGLTMKSEVPFGPFLIASCLIFWLAQLHGIPLPLYLLGI